MNFSGTHLRTAYPGGSEASSGWCPEDACKFSPVKNLVNFRESRLISHYVAPLIVKSPPP